MRAPQQRQGGAEGVHGPQPADQGREVQAAQGKGDVSAQMEGPLLAGRLHKSGVAEGIEIKPDVTEDMEVPPPAEFEYSLDQCRKLAAECRCKAKTPTPRYGKPTVAAQAPKYSKAISCRRRRMAAGSSSGSSSARRMPARPTTANNPALS